MIKYTVALESISLQSLRVTMVIPVISDRITLTLPAWIPGSYKIRDFAKNLGEFEAKSVCGETMSWWKTDKQTWQVHTKAKPAVISYVVVANDYSVRGAFLNDQYVFFNGTSVFLEVQRAHDVALQMAVKSETAPANWQLTSSMPNHVESYQQLIDHPVFWGIGQTQHFTVDGVDFSFLLSGTQPVDIDRICKDLEPICKHHLSLFPAPAPMQNYLFITLLADSGYGGLEHCDSTVLMYPRFDLPMRGEVETSNKKDEYVNYLSLCSHELFHAWHVKRIRPKVLLKPDLHQEVYTPQLWIYEGITSFYDDLAVVRSGQMSPEQYCKVLGQNLTRLMHTPGKNKQSVAASSFDAWTRFYQQDALSNNHIVSYYTKGGIIALGLDLLLRKQSNGKQNMDRVMQALWQQYGVNETGTDDDVITSVCAQLGVDISNYVDQVVYGEDDVDLTGLLPTIGLTVNWRNRANSSDKGGTELSTPPKHDFGLTVSANGSLGCKVTQLQADSAATVAGLQIDDIVVAINEWVATESLWLRLLAQAELGCSINLTVVRQGRLLQLTMPVRAAANKAATITITNKQLFYSWLGLTASSAAD